MSNKVTDNILVYAIADSRDGSQLAQASRRLLVLARSLTSGQVIAAAPAGISDAYLQEFGVDLVLEYSIPAPVYASIGGYVCDLLYAATQKHSVDVVFTPSTNWGKQASAQLAARLKSSASVDITKIEVVDSNLQLSKNVLGGTWNTSFALRRGIPVVAIRTVGFSDQPEQAAPAISRETLEFAQSAPHARVEIVAAEAGEGGTSRLHDASVVVCGGRGTQGDFTPVNQLAEVLDAAVGSTRVVCEEGWMPRSAQVGQSGAMIAPHLYVGLGISGDPYHMCGIRAAGKIVAINNDPQAAIFRYCDFGVVGDLEPVVSQAVEYLRAHS